MIRSNRLLPEEKVNVKPPGAVINSREVAPGEGFEGGTSLIGDTNPRIVSVKVSPKRSHENLVGEDSTHSEHTTNQRARINAGYTESLNMVYQNANPNYFLSIK